MSTCSWCGSPLKRGRCPIEEREREKLLTDMATDLWADKPHPALVFDGPALDISAEEALERWPSPPGWDDAIAEAKRIHETLGEIFNDADDSRKDERMVEAIASALHRYRSAHDTALMVSAMASLAFAYGYLSNLGHAEAATRMYTEAEAIKAALGCSRATP